MSDYRITREECEKNIKGVCEGCGGPITPIDTVDNEGNPTFWAGCESCNSFRGGVPERVFRIARKLVETEEMLPLRFMSLHDYSDTPKRLEYFRRCQTADLSRTIVRILYLTKEAGL